MYAFLSKNYLENTNINPISRTLPVFKGNSVLYIYGIYLIQTEFSIIINPFFIGKFFVQFQPKPQRRVPSTQLSSHTVHIAAAR